ncbi:MAG: glutaredoxin domain-containing protein [Pseudomonadota bacterium]
MKPVEIYTTPICPYCSMAKRLLDQKGVAYTEINVMGDAGRKAEMLDRANGQRTVPQIFHPWHALSLKSLQPNDRCDSKRFYAFHGASWQHFRNFI